MSVRMDEERFEELVSEALDLIPQQLAEAIDNVVVLVDARHDEEPSLLGLYATRTMRGHCRTRSPFTAMRSSTSASPTTTWCTRWRSP